MDSERLLELRAHFEGLIDLTEEERAPRIADLRARDPALALELERLLLHDSAAASFLGQPARDPLASAAAQAEALAARPDLVGRAFQGYRLIRALASGGMGTVFEAEQERPRRRVALKTLGLKSLSEDSVRRFRIEAEVLGRLKHPAIAQIYETGVADLDGVPIPYLAMELVEDAHNLVAHCTERGLGQRKRIELFQEACAAVQHGHQRGVLHRDLKPDNVLVDGAGHVKVIDFGLARTTDADPLAVSLAATRAGNVLGTLSTMSPEHASGSPDAIDARSDVYSLGCILYELLCGAPPLDLEGLSLAEALRRLQTAEPKVPAELARELRWILSKALERDPERRYGSAAELSQDLARYVSHESVQAGPPSRVYRLVKFGRRNRVFLTGVAAVIAALGVGLWRARTEARNARVALAGERLQQEVALGVSGFFVDMFSSLDAYRMGSEVRVIDVLRESEPDLARVKNPAALALLEGLLGQGFLKVEDFERAEEHLVAAHAGVKEHFAPDEPERLRVEAVYADFLEQRGHAREALELSLEILPRLRRVHGDGDFWTQYVRCNLSVCYEDLQRFEDAERVLREALSFADGVHTEASYRHRLATTLSTLERFDQAEAEFAFARAAAERAGDELFSATIRLDYSSLLRRLRRNEEALAELQAVDEAYATLGPTLSNRFAVSMNTAGLLLDMKRHEEAAPYLQRCEELLATLEPKIASERHIMLQFSLAELALARSDGARATQCARNARRLLEELGGRGHERMPAMVDVAARGLELSGEPAAAEAELRQALAEAAQAHGTESKTAANCLAGLVSFLGRQRRYAEAAEQCALLVSMTPEESRLYEPRVSQRDQLRAKAEAAGQLK
jgi:tetratricopeptide (TPR) repeat protein